MNSSISFLIMYSRGQGSQFFESCLKNELSKRLFDEIGKYDMGKQSNRNY